MALVFSLSSRIDTVIFSLHPVATLAAPSLASPHHIPQKGGLVAVRTALVTPFQSRGAMLPGSRPPEFWRRPWQLTLLYLIKTDGGRDCGPHMPETSGAKLYFTHNTMNSEQIFE